MSDDQPSTADENQTDAEQSIMRDRFSHPQVSRRFDPDIDLARLVGLSNRLGIGLGLGVSVNGLWIEGLLISGPEWAARVAHGLRTAAASANEATKAGFDVIADAFDDRSNAMLKAISEQGDEESFDAALERSPRFICLGNARSVGNGTGTSPATGMNVRIRLDSVDGWALGILGEVDNEPWMTTPLPVSRPTGE